MPTVSSLRAVDPKTALEGIKGAIPDIQLQPMRSSYATPRILRRYSKILTSFPLFDNRYEFISGDIL